MPTVLQPHLDDIVILTPNSRMLSLRACAVFSALVLLTACSADIGILNGSFSSTDTTSSPSSTASTSTSTTTSTSSLAGEFVEFSGNLTLVDGDVDAGASALIIDVFDGSEWRCQASVVMSEVHRVEPTPHERVFGWWRIVTNAAIDEYCSIPVLVFYLGIGSVPSSIDPMITQMELSGVPLKGLFFGEQSNEFWSIGITIPPDGPKIPDGLLDGTYELTTLYPVPW